MKIHCLASLFILNLVLVSVRSGLKPSIRYVLPNDSSNITCPDGNETCLTLDHYIKNKDVYLTTGSVFLFFAGNYTLQIEVNLINVSNITFRNEGNDTNIIIACRKGITISCKNVRNFKIEGLKFVFYPNQLKFNQSSSVLKLTDSRDILISNSLFQGSIDLNKPFVRAIYSTRSAIIIMQCVFQGSTGKYGGAIYADSSFLNLTDNLFLQNLAKFRGGAVYASKSALVIGGTWSNLFSRNFATWEGGAIYCISSAINITGAHEIGTTFSFNFAKWGAGLLLRNSTAILNGLSVIEFGFNTAQIGGGMFIIYSSVFSNTRYLNFTSNTAVAWGGAIHCENGYLTLGERNTNNSSNHHFSSNIATKGAAIHFISSHPPRTLTLIGYSYFINNTVKSFKNAAGGAIHVYFSHFILSGNVQFVKNRANYGGGLYLAGSNAEINGVLIFTGNIAELGGGMYVESSRVRLVTDIYSQGQLNFFDNIAWNQGGGLYISNQVENNNVIISANFVNNTAKQCGGAIYIENTGRNVMYFEGINIEQNSASALCVLDGSMAFVGVTRIIDNTGISGGGIYSRSSSLFFTGHTLFRNNSGLIGGAIFSLFGTKLTFNGTARFTHNSADTDGGALYAVGTDINFMFNTIATFDFNSAQNGGAIYLRSTAILKIEQRVNFTTLCNHAFQYGGVLYYEDTTVPIQCNLDILENNTNLIELPYCFLKLEGIVSTQSKYYITTKMNSYNDSALRDGSFLYGGLLDRCQLQIIKSSDARRENSMLPYKVFQSRYLLHVEIQDNATKAITSRPYQLCFCVNSKTYICSEARNLVVNRGQRFNISLLALDQMRSSTSTVVTAKVSETAALKLQQNSQFLDGQCSNLSYSLYSTQEHETIILYPDGPCRDTGRARAVISVALLQCPSAFALSGQECICEERLQFYEAECIIDDSVYIRKKSSSKFWMGTLNSNGSYAGLILYKTCPTDYCKSDAVNITLDNLDAQCNANRGGLLCGSCKANHSLLLGGFKCQVCPNTYLGLLFAFAAAGVILVIFLSVLKLTVATGMINSLILYANTVQVNKMIFFPTSTPNVLTVFIAWLNLDLGFEVCFYDEMDAYIQTWLQFAFPLYIWFLISVIIVTSRYSITMTKLIGHNPIAVLATLLLMSYTKILKVIIDVYSSVHLDYPNKTVTVWLKDANIPYLQSRHLALTVVTSLILVFFFLPYTLLLLLGFKYYRYLGKLSRKLKPLLDSYYAPYKAHTRYWTGFLLLVRCVLYIVFSFNSLGGTKKSLLAINITFTGIVVIAWLSARIYKKTLNNIIEASVYLNLVALSALALADANSAALVYSLIGMVFVLMLGIITYHFHICYIAKSAIWLKIRIKISALTNKKEAEILMDGLAVKPPQDTHKVITKTVIDIREPLLEN